MANVFGIPLAKLSLTAHIETATMEGVFGNPVASLSVNTVVTGIVRYKISGNPVALLSTIPSISADVIKIIYSSPITAVLSVNTSIGDSIMEHGGATLYYLCVDDFDYFMVTDVYPQPFIKHRRNRFRKTICDDIYEDSPRVVYANVSVVLGLNAIVVDSGIIMGFFITHDEEYIITENEEYLLYEE